MGAGVTAGILGASYTRANRGEGRRRYKHQRCDWPDLWRSVGTWGHLVVRRLLALCDLSSHHSRRIHLIRDSNALRGREKYLVPLRSVAAK